MTGQEMDLGRLLGQIRADIAGLRVDLTNLAGRVEHLKRLPVPPESERVPGCTCRVISGPHSHSCALNILTLVPEPRLSDFLRDVEMPPPGTKVRELNEDSWGEPGPMMFKWEDGVPVRHKKPSLLQAYGTPTPAPVGLRSESARVAEQRMIGEMCGPTEEIL